MCYATMKVPVVNIGIDKHVFCYDSWQYFHTVQREGEKKLSILLQRLPVIGRITGAKGV